MNHPGVMAARQDKKADQLDQVLPQTQCTKCGYDGCRPYAQAIVDGQAEINRCPPGGQAGVRALARLTGAPDIPLDLSRGVHTGLSVAVIDEEHCIGCTLCIRACPVDAIVGANKHMHVVLPELCTGCELCVAPCPVDCIRMEAVQPAREWTRIDADAARRRYLKRQTRLERVETARHRPMQAARPSTAPLERAPAAPDRKSAAIAAALARARARRTS